MPGFRGTDYAYLAVEEKLSCQQKVDKKVGQ